MRVLAYVFWHWRREDVSVERYRGLIRDFHASLAGRSSAGFLRSSAFEIPGAPFLAHPGPVFEDWYLLDGSAALDPLDRSAISTPHAEPHDQIAGVVAGGTAGLYRLRAGEPSVGGPRFALWFSKPRGMSYAELYALLETRTSAGEALWGRQMVLGPAPEFCLHRGGDAPPPPIEFTRIPLERVWP